MPPIAFLGLLGIAAAVFLGQAGPLLAAPLLGVACLLTTAAVAGMAAADAPPGFAISKVFQRASAGVAAQGVITAAVVAAGVYPGPPKDLAELEVIPAMGGLSRLDVPDGSLVVIGSPSCPECGAAESCLRERRLAWLVRYPFNIRQNRECWTHESISWQLPTLLRWEGDGYRVLVRGFSVTEWEAFR